MNIKKFLRKTFPSFFPFKTTPRTYEVLDEVLALIPSEYCTISDIIVEDPRHFIVNIYVKTQIFSLVYGTIWLGQDSKNPCFNLKRKLIDKVYEAEVTYEGDLLPYIAVLNRDKKALELIPDSEEGLESLAKEYKNRIMYLMPQIQQAKELFALKEGMKTGEFGNERMLAI